VFVVSTVNHDNKVKKILGNCFFFIVCNEKSNIALFTDEKLRSSNCITYYYDQARSIPSIVKKQTMKRNRIKIEMSTLFIVI
jgi:hypothetical protein